MINPKMQKYKNLKISLKGNGFEIERSYDNNYQIVVKSPCGDLVDFYSSTGSFSFRKERIRGKGYENLLRCLRFRDNLYFKDFIKPKDKIKVRGNTTQEDAIRLAMDKFQKDKNTKEYLTLKIKLDDLEVDEIIDSVSKEFMELREAKPQNFLEKIAMKYLRKRHYKIID